MYQVGLAREGVWVGLTEGGEGAGLPWSVERLQRAASASRRSACSRARLASGASYRVRLEAELARRD